MIIHDNQHLVQPIDCRTAVQRLWDYLDEELDAERYAEVTAHVESCRACAQHYDFARAFLDALSAAQPMASETGVLKSRVVAALRAEGFGQG